MNFQMKTNIRIGLVACAFTIAFTSCTDLDEKVFDRIDAGTFYQNEQSVKGAVASIYNQAGNCFAERFYFLQELSADQIAWRVWNGGLWGYDEGEKYVLSTQTWTSESKIIKDAWTNCWPMVGLANNIINDLEKVTPDQLNISQEKMESYIAEVRTLRAWAYYNMFEVWGGALPLNTSSGAEIPGTADPDWSTSCHKIYDFIANELDESVSHLAKESGDNSTRTRVNQAMNRMLKARLLLNAQVFIGEEHYEECEQLSKQIINGDFGAYQLAEDYRTIYDLGNNTNPEVIFAFACKDGQGATNAWCNVRDMPMLPYNYDKYFNITQFSGIGSWNCCIVTPSHDNSGNVLPTGGTDTGGKSFILDYGDKLGGVWDRLDDRDIRKANFVYNSATRKWKGNFLKGIMKENFGKGATMKADADRDGQDLVYVDQLGTFQNLGRNLETVMSPKWGETNSGIRLVKYPIYDAGDAGGFKDINEVEFRLAEAYYNVAECEMRKGNIEQAKNYVNAVRKRYFSASDWSTVKDQPGPGFQSFDLDWMLSQWGLEFLGEGRRRRTDLRRYDKFTQGQWWFFGRATEEGVDLPARRDRKYEWYPLPESALSVNPGLIQNSNYTK
jgi:hypothetical protein